MKSIPIHTDSSRKETIRFREDLLTYSLYTPGPEGCFYGDIPWHWHEEFEFGCLLGGRMVYRTSSHEYVLEEGDGIFINSGVLHSLHPLEPREKVRLQSHFCHRSFIAGAPGSIFDIKYVTPVMEQGQLEAFPIYRKDPGSRSFLEKLDEAAALSRRKEPFFELRLRSLFSGLWEEIYRRASAQAGGEGIRAAENERIKCMLSYIQDHYHEHISIASIAARIPVSERECYRLFKSCLGLTPGDYLMEYRLQKARERLMATSENVVDIAMETGFGSSSYFGKVFRQYHRMTPRQYRNYCRRAT